MTSSEEELEFEPRPRDLGVTVASAFFRNRPQEKCKPSDEKRILLHSWSQKADQSHRLYEHFENGISCSLQQETTLLIKDIVQYVKHQAKSTFGYIPTAIIRHGVRMTDRDAVFDLIETGLSSSGCAAEVVRLDASHTTDIESMKREIISGVMTEAMFSQMTGKEKVRKSYEQRLPFKYFAQSYAAASTSSQDRKRSVIVMIEELERADASALTALFSMIKNNIQDMPVLVMLGCCTNHLSLQQLLPAAAYDMLFVKTFQTASAAVMFERVMNEILVSSDVYSFKLGPTCLKLLQDNFDFYNFSLEKVLSIVKLMIVKHVGDNHCSILSVTSSDDLKLVLKQMSTSELKQLRSEVEQLPSIQSAAVDLKSIGTKDTDSFRNFIKRSINQIHNGHKDYLQAMRCLSILMTRTSESGHHLAAAASITPFLSINMEGMSNITETNEFKNIQRSLSMLSLDQLKEKLETCINNHLAPDSSIAQMLGKEYENLLQLEKDSVSMNGAGSNDPAASLEKSQSRITFEGCRNRHDWKARLKDSLPGNKTDAGSGSKKRKLSKFEEFRTGIVSSICQFFADLTPPFSLPLSEVVYFNDSSFIADHYFPCTRTEIMESLRHPLPIRSSGGPSGGDEVGEMSDHELDMARIYQQIASSSVSVSMFDLMECLKSQKDTCMDQNGDDADASPRKKVRKGKQAASKIESERNNDNDAMARQRFFTIINDMEYIGILQKDKRKAGRVTKLVWE